MNSALFIILMLGLGAALSYGVADFFGAKASKQLGPVTSAFCVQAVTTLLFVVGYAVLVHHVPRISPGAFWYAVGGAALMAIGTYTLYVAFEIGPVSLVSPLSAAYPLVTAIVGLLFFDAHLSGVQTAGIVLVVSGIMAASGILELGKTERRLSKGPLFALATTLAWGLSYPLLDRAVSEAGWAPVTLIEFIGITMILGVVLWSRRHQEHVTSKLLKQTFGNIFVVSAGATLLLAFLAVNIGLGYDATSGSLVVAISSAYPVITVLLALRHFKERVKKTALLGAGITITGVVLLVA